MTKKIDQAANLVKAAHVRAAIIALLNENTLSRPRIEENLGGKFAELDYNTHNLGSLLKRMVLNRQIGSRINGEVVEYGKAGLEPLSDVATAAVAKPATRKSPTKSLVGMPPDLKIDLVRATGKVRMTLNGMVIEIGVV